MKKKSILSILIITLIIAISILVYFIIKKAQEDNKKYEIETVTEYKYFVVKEEDRYGVIDINGNKIIQTEYEDVKIPNPEKPIFICNINNHAKVLNEKAEEQFTEYEEIEPLRLKSISGDLMYEKSVLKYRKNGKYGIIDFKGKEITKPIYEEIDTLQFKEGELIVRKEDKYGVINIKGSTLVKANYDKIEVDKFYEEENGYKKSGYIVSEKTEDGYRYGYTNLEGKQIIEIIYNDLYRITDIESDDIYTICAENGKYGLLKNGKKVIENEYQSLVYNKSNNTLTGLKGKQYGIISIDGEIIVPFEYKQIDIAGEYIYATNNNNNNTKIFDSKGQGANIDKNVSLINIENTDYKIYIKTTNGKTTYDIYKNGVKTTKNEYTYIQYLYDNYFIACNINGKLGIIDENEKNKINFNYNSIQIIEDTNMLQVVNNETETMEIYSKEMKKISELRNATIESNKEYIKMYNNEEIKYITKEQKEVKNTEIYAQNKIFAKRQGNKWGFVNANGNNIIDYKYEKVTEINKYGFAGIKQDEKWGVINNEGKIIVEPKYELNINEPIFIGEYYQVIYGNGEIYYTNDTL